MLEEPQQWDDPYDHNLSEYVTGAVAELRSRGMDPISCIEKITQSRPPIDTSQLSWASAHMLIFLELKSNTAGKVCENLAKKCQLNYSCISNTPQKNIENNQMGSIEIDVNELKKRL